MRIRLFPKSFDCFFRIIVLRRGNTTLCHLKRYNKLFRDGERHRRDFLFYNDTLQREKLSLIALENYSWDFLFCFLTVADVTNSTAAKRMSNDAVFKGHGRISLKKILKALSALI